MKKKHIILVLLLICLLKISISVTYAKYSDYFITSIGGSVAKWDVSIEASEDKDITLVAGNDTKEYIIKVKSNSEVKAKYSIVVSNLPENVEVKLDERDYESGDVVTFDNVGTINADDDSPVEHRLTFNALLEADKIEDSNIKIEVVFVQDEI